MQVDSDVLSSRAVAVKGNATNVAQGSVHMEKQVNNYYGSMGASVDANTDFNMAPSYINRNSEDNSHIDRTEMRSEVDRILQRYSRLALWGLPGLG